MGLAGGIIGGIIGGPWGIAIGAGLGSYLTGSGKSEPEGSRKTDGIQGLKVFFLCLGKLAKADGVVTQNEADFIKGILRELDFQGDAKKQLIAAFNAGKTDPRTFPQCVQPLASFFPGRNDRTSLMQTFCVLAVADGSLDAGTKALLTEAEKLLNLSGFTDNFIVENFRTHSEEHREEPRVAPQTDELAEAYRTLEIPPASTDAEVKQARRKKLLEYHPDRIQGKGLPDSFIAFAAEQTRKINEAYELIAARRGMKNQ